MVEEKHKRVRVKKTTSNIKIIPSTYKSFKEGNRDIIILIEFN